MKKKFDLRRHVGGKARKEDGEDAETFRTVLINQLTPPTPPGRDPPPTPSYPDNSFVTAKYTVWNFLPKNLFEQFRRLANFYFLCLAIIHSTIDSPVSPLTSILPLLFVITVTAVKQGYEDWLRHREDNKVNNSPVAVLREGQIKELRQRDIAVGDVVEVHDNEEFPCDMVLLSSLHAEAKCDVTTANLDGETNLKTFTCPAETKDLKTDDELWQLQAIIECQLPQANLYDFKGRLQMYQIAGKPAELPLGTENLLLRGAKLKNTPAVYGAAVYTGKQTKMALNSKMTSNKFSTVEKTLNYYLLFFMVLMVVEIFICTILKYQIFDQDVTNTMWYLDYQNFNPVKFADIYQDSVSFLIIFSYIIPVSLYVILEIQKFLSTLFLQWDKEIVGEGKDEDPKVNTSDLNEELGQVEYLFSDKTGTLTENIMHFRQGSIAGQKYVDVEGQLYVLHEDDSTTPLPDVASPGADSEVETFLETLALCHTVEVSAAPANDEEKENDVNSAGLTLNYQAASPDEKALVEACASFGVVFRGTRNNQMTLDVFGDTRTYTRLQVLDFDSDRKCMSVVVKDAGGKIWLLTKGAESSVLKRCSFSSPDQEQLQQTTLDHINDFAMVGLRTLAVGRRQLSPSQLHEFEYKLSKARQELDDREAAVRKVTDKMEAELTLLGATGVEDLLQEGVQETLESLRVAGIKVWVLTGDKVETAVNIAYSCGHFKRFMSVLTLTGIKDDEQADACLGQCLQVSQDESVTYGLVVDGGSLLMLLEKPLRDDFYDLCRRCTAVVCCRMSPSQKAETVRLVKTSKEAPVCAAIGDGANDVSMIQEAHVGLGVMGKEGRQAVRCADFGFARFKFLKKMLLVHGHWNYVRLATFTQYSFYKNVAFNTPMVFYSFWNAYSTQSVYEGLILTLYNVTATTLCVLVYALLEQNLPAKLLMERPHLYQRLTRNAIMTWPLFFKWTAFGLYHAVVMYFGLMLACRDDTCGLPNGQTSDLYLFGLTLSTLCVYVVTIKIAIESYYFTVLYALSFVVSFVGYSAIYLLYCGAPVQPFVTYGIFYAYYRLWESPSLNLACMVLGVLCLLPDLLDRVYRDCTDPELRRARFKKKLSKKRTCSVSSSATDKDELSPIPVRRTEEDGVSQKSTEL